ncbi:nucleoside triphosphate pyrophosphohydrolase [Acidocella aminolytica]|uniref:Nucleoside triphosphate pyrophosphohydrolase n=1 Tax=Acidocella aminolytica 101 = DSM 11237 TaxID=1120923 RepID=A0A0D6PBF5_9PROT|nr:nucleoside triphosphate pyrophosphohydrolase [Acidocella aminolytica]GAN78666.1 nucleotide pyrophosphohydrolase MazG [Acidocella aminolytica 101 = DSM 11237]GBQ36684.1 nucleotide pyrophosphohydrolase MazG [Acidocella aminolytica 101 = DSM 11237]SHE44834.1 ATP diphosphatase [Acidocella aminolytica 101 = DSM 11237]
MSNEAPIQALINVMAALRDPETGCPWDKEQDFTTIAPYTIEEAYEVRAAIAAGEPEQLKDELGDLLFQVVYHARMAEEHGWFKFDDVADAITQKMIRRHPHVFGNEASRSTAAQTAAWEAQKAAERANLAQHGALDGVAEALPALKRAQKLTNRAARVKFDWPNAEAVLDKLAEEIAELRAELAEAKPDRLADELGDLLFVLVNLARKLGQDAETCLEGANEKFIRRFSRVEALLAERGRTPSDSTLDEMETLWATAKQEGL